MQSLGVTVIGTGYLGATHAVCMAELGFPVLGIDVDEQKIAALAAGEVPFFEPGLGELLRKNLERGRLRFTTCFAEAGEFGDVHFLCVGTPQSPGSQAADLSYLRAALASLVPHVRRECLIVGKSTVPVGTAEDIREWVADNSRDTAQIEVAWNPEFLREGFAVDDSLRPDRLVFGVTSRRAEHVLRQVYAPILEAGTPLVVTDLATAQLTKVAANAFLATKISFINAMAEMCEAVDGDVLDLAKALSHDDRIGGRFLRPGLGFGGGCLPKDLRGFVARAEELGMGDTVSFLRDVDAINTRRRSRVVEIATDMLGSLPGTRVAALGTSFKPNSDDIRDSPALDVASSLHDRGAHVSIYDPAANDKAARAYPQLRHAASVKDALGGADLVVVLTEWAVFREMDPTALRSLVRTPRVLDARHALDSASWTAAGWAYRALGRRREVSVR